MSFSLRAAFLAGTLAMQSTGVCAEPITLTTALDQANAVSPRIAVSEARIRAAEALARQAGLRPNPEATVEVENFGGTGPYSGLGGSEVTVGVSQQFERGGKRGARRALASAQRELAALDLDLTRAALAFDVRTAFAQLRAAEDRAVLARENAARAEQFVQTATILVDSGRDPPLRQLRAEALLAEATAESVRSFGELLSARRVLQLLIASEDEELSAVGEENAISPPLPTEQAGTLDVRRAEAAVAEARARIDLARADAIPDINASGGVRQFTDGRDAAFIVGLSMPIPIRNRNQGGIEAAQADALAAESELLIARVDANRNAYNASIALQAADARLAVLAGPNLEQAEEALRLATIGYNAGRFTLVELLDAQAALTSARQALIDARLDRALAAAALVRAQAQ